MAMNVTGGLKALGWEGDRADFNDLLVDVQHSFCPDWSDEQLLCRPRSAIEFCDLVRRRANNQNLPDELILRALVHIRRNVNQ